MDSAFQVHRLNEKGMQKAKKMSEAFDNLYNELCGMCVMGRELAIARSKLEEACFFAKKAMANDSDNQNMDD